jgi:3-methyladenine DNA glycosylase Tag
METQDCGFVKILADYLGADYLGKEKLFNRDDLLQKYHRRKKQGTFSLKEYVKTMVYAQLSSRRPWCTIEKNKEEIDKIFYNFDIANIKQKDGAYFATELQKIKCGNQLIKKQMESLKKNIETLERITKEHHSVDEYFNSFAEPLNLAVALSEPRKEGYKLKQMGLALVCEYIKNMGIDIAKPDTHTKRMLGNNVLGFSKTEKAGDKEAIKLMKEIAKNTEMTQIEVDALLWRYCANGERAICTDKNPKCHQCVIKEYCNYYKSTQK